MASDADYSHGRLLGIASVTSKSLSITELQSYYLFDDKFGRPARGNDKGNVEGMVGYTRRNFMVPAPRYDSFDDLNAHLEQKCLARQGDKLRGYIQTVGERLLSSGHFDGLDCLGILILVGNLPERCLLAILMRGLSWLMRA